MSITGSLVKRVQEAIVLTFDYADLRQALAFRLDKNLDELVPQTATYPNQVFELIQRLKRSHELLPLLHCLTEERPRSQELAALYDEMLAAQHGHLPAFASSQGAPSSELDMAHVGLARLPVDQVAPAATLPAGSYIPFQPNPLFVDRDHELRQLARAFNAWEGDSMPTVAICGIGGVGKSQLAIEFAHRYGSYFAGGVYWVSFVDAAAVPSEITNACTGLPELPAGFQELDLQTQLNLILSAWRSGRPRLLIFDDCEDESLLEQWRPTTGAACILLTSLRDRFDPALGVRAVPLRTLSRSDSVALLRKFLTSTQTTQTTEDSRAAQPIASPERRDTLVAIADELGDLPLALHVAGTYLDTYAGVVDGEAYLARLRSSPLDPALKRAVGRSPTKHDLSVARTFALSYERLDSASATDLLALNLLARTAYFAPGEPIPLSLLIMTLELSEDSDALLQAADALHRLANLGLLSSKENGDPFLHRLLARFVLSQQSDDRAQAAVELTMHSEAHRINWGGDPRPLLTWRVHLRHVTDHALLRSDERAAALATQLGYHLQISGDLAGAKPYFEKSLTIRDQLLGDGHSDTAQSLNDLGLLLHDMGDLEDARPYYERSLAIREQLLGEQHLDTVQSLNNLGCLLKDMGNLATGKSYLERSLAICVQVLGEQNPFTANILHNLGRLVQVMGDLEGARSYLERSLGIMEQVFGEQHPLTAANLNSLGCLLQAMGDLEGARPQLERSLAIREQILGEQHPETAQSLWMIGVNLINEGQPAAARLYLERARTAFSATLGPSYPDTQAVQGLLDSLDE